MRVGMVVEIPAAMMLDCPLNLLRDMMKDFEEAGLIGVITKVDVQSKEITINYATPDHVDAFLLNKMRQVPYPIIDPKLITGDESE